MSNFNLESFLEEIKDNHYPNETNNFNPYNNPHQAQKKCKHMWDNDTDAIYVDHRGKRICAICKKEI